MKNTEERSIELINQRKKLYGTIVHERTGLNVVKGAIVSERVMDIAIADMPAGVARMIVGAHQIELDTLVNCEHRRDYQIVHIHEIAVDTLELGAGEQWKHRDTGEIFYVLDVLRVSTGKAVIMKGLHQFVRVRDGGIKK